MRVFGGGVDKLDVLESLVQVCDPPDCLLQEATIKLFRLEEALSQILSIILIRKVHRRDLHVHKEYQDNARITDIKHYQVSHGPISRRLAEIQPIVPCSFGRWGETGDPVNSLVAVMARRHLT